MFEADLFTLPRIWKEIQQSADYRGRQKDIAEFNKTSAWRKRGITITPCRCVLHLCEQHLVILNDLARALGSCIGCFALFTLGWAECNSKPPVLQIWGLPWGRCRESL